MTARFAAWVGSLAARLRVRATALGQRAGGLGGSAGGLGRGAGGLGGSAGGRWGSAGGLGRGAGGLAGAVRGLARGAGGLAGRAWSGWRGASWPIRAAIAGGVVLLALGVGLAGTWATGSDADSRWSAGSQGGDHGPGPSPEPSSPGQGRADDPGQDAQAGSAVNPPAFVQEFAQQPGTGRQPLSPSPTDGVKIAEGTDGCDHAYGGRDVCVPWEFPAGVTDKCAWLRERGFKPLKIEGGRDRHALDRNADGTACGEGD